MYKIRPAHLRGKTKNAWLSSFHTFSFGQYYGRYNMGFGDLRVINEDYISPEGGFGLHRHDNMEILSIILEGELEHQDSTGVGYIIKVGEIQKMSAGRGIFHSEFNPSSSRLVHFLQIWILPQVQDLNPEYEKRSFDLAKMTNEFLLVASSNGENGSLRINQDAKIYQCILEAEKRIKYGLKRNRKTWLQIADGVVEIKGQTLEKGDGLAIYDEEGEMEIKGVGENTNFILFDLK